MRKGVLKRSNPKLQQKLKWIIVFSVFFTIQLQTIAVKAPHVHANPQLLSNQLDRFIKGQPLFTGAVVGVSVRSQTTGELLYDYNGSTRLRPASNLKLLTAASALDVLGEKHIFTTKIFVNGKIRDGVLYGDLFLQGGGDPTLLLKDLESLASTVANKGIKEIKGYLIGDDTRYDSLRYSMDMPWSDEETYYGAEISALTIAPDEDYDAGTVILEVEPSNKVGEQASIKIEPMNTHIKVQNDAVTGASDVEEDLIFTREHGTNTIKISGKIPHNGQLKREWIAVSNTSKYTVHLFNEELKKAGVKLKAGYKLGVTPATAKLIGEHQSMPLAQMLVPFMKLSNNVHGEVFVKEMGKVNLGTGSFEQGQSVLTKSLTELGLNLEDQVIRDGSGISHVNLIAPNNITKLLFSIQSKPWFFSYYHSLPVAGAKEKMVGGTLRHRMKQEPLLGNVVAKTGTLSTVSSISGYVKTKTQGSLIFSILINNVIDEDEAKHVEDQMLHILASQ